MGMLICSLATLLQAWGCGLRRLVAGDRVALVGPRPLLRMLITEIAAVALLAGEGHEVFS